MANKFTRMISDMSFKAKTYALVVLSILGVSTTNQLVNNETIDIHVDNTEVFRSGKSGNSRIIYTENETFKNTNSFFRLKFNSTALQGKLKEGGDYRVKVYGFKFENFDIFRNISEVTPIKPAPSTPSTPK